MVYNGIVKDQNQNDKEKSHGSYLKIHKTHPKPTETPTNEFLNGKHSLCITTTIVALHMATRSAIWNLVLRLSMGFGTLKFAPTVQFFRLVAFSTNINVPIVLWQGMPEKTAASLWFDEQCTGRNEQEKGESPLANRCRVSCQITLSAKIHELQ